jgi:hypothetical protein
VISRSNLLGILFILSIGLLLTTSCRFIQGADEESSLTYRPATRPPSAATRLDNPNPPPEPVKLVFIHKSIGYHWLDDRNGGLGLALRDNNYFVSDTNYGWGPDNIGDHTAIGDWQDWFRGSRSNRYLNALYTSNLDYSRIYTRLENPDPDRENEVVLFIPRFDDSNLKGSPDDPPMRGNAASVGGAKYVYIDLLNYFATQPDKLFVLMTAPPVTEDDSKRPPKNARALNNWLVNDWLAEYPFDNVAVFDFYNVMTSNDGSVRENDLGNDSGNHHRWWDGSVQHIQTVENDLAAYPTIDSHPNYAGYQKATSELLPLLNVYYHRWQGDKAEPEATIEPTADS